MAPKRAPFTVLLHFTGQKTKEELQELYAAFYIQAIKDKLADSQLSDDEKKAVIDRLIQYHAQSG